MTSSLGRRFTVSRNNNVEPFVVAKPFAEATTQDLEVKTQDPRPPEPEVLEADLLQDGEIAEGLRRKQMLECELELRLRRAEDAKQMLAEKVKEKRAILQEKARVEEQRRLKKECLRQQAEDLRKQLQELEAKHAAAQGEE